MVNINMKEYRPTEKPLIAILMAVYDPRMEWLTEQLKSLNAQTYPNLVLHICDDCSPNVPFHVIESCVREHITAFPYTVERNEKNLGSNLTFERLTRECDEGDFFSYCDQDDIWLPEKLSVLQNAIECENSQLVCSDMLIIDADGNHTADSITKVRKHHVFRSGTGLAGKLLVTNWVTGCTMLVRRDAAKAAIPYCPYMVHDHFIALCCAARGKIISLPDKLIEYRIHENNQTLAMKGVVDKDSYLELRIVQMQKRARWLYDNLDCSDELRGELAKCIEWADARYRNWTVHRGGAAMLKYKRFSPLVSAYELVVGFLPAPLFKFTIELNRKNIL